MNIIIRTWLLALILTVATGSPAQNPIGGSADKDPKTTKSSAAGAPRAAPLPRPGRILLSWSSDPATSQAATWRTAEAVPSPRGMILRASADPGVFAKPNTIRAVSAVTTEVVTDSGKCVFYHTAEFTGLEPDTRYAYRVGTDSAWSEWNHVTTASRKPEKFQFIYLGDAQNQLDSLWPRSIRSAFRAAPRSRFILYAGDLVNNARSDLEWQQWFQASGWVHRVIPCVAVAGNHEYWTRKQGEKEEHLLTPLWQPQFAFPRNGIEGIEETSYFLDYQGLRLIALDSNRKIDEQARWLEGVLKSNPHRWTVATFHHPVFSTAKGRDNPGLRKSWAPLFEKFHVDLVLQGHDHSYGRTQSVPGGKRMRSRASGTVYVVSVSGPKMYQVNPAAAKVMQRVGQDRQLFQVITVEKDRLHYRCFTVTGELFDDFTLVKNGHGASRLIERVPEIQQGGVDQAATGK